MRAPSNRLFFCACVALLVLACGGSKTPAKSAAAVGGPPITLVPPEGPDLAKLESAIAAMDRQDYPRAIRALEELRSRHPDNGVVLHELALAYRLARKPKEAVNLLMPYRARLPPATLAGLGSALDELGRGDEAVAVLREGLVRYPKSGLLHADLGTALYNHGKPDEALAHYQKGIELDPAAPSNYIRLSLVLSQTPYRGLTLVFGETFRLLEPTSERSDELARIMAEVLRDSVKRTPAQDGTIQATVTLAPPITIERPEQVAELPLVNVFELAFGPPLVRAHRDGLTLASLHKARVEFVAIMNRPESPFDWNRVPVFRFMREANANGMLEVYDYWLYGPAFPEEFEAWATANAANAETLARYLGEHPLFGVAPND
ncbi:MAG TPA: tetratricopeptide repeat protein [Polyangiaceae bacterium]|nr:tetratricopeptide repeat protein [Polyangiaceae bacterium]